MNYIISAVIGYLLGSISISVLLSQLVFKKDVRTEGSKNAGATNVARIFGMSAGVIVLAGDVLKTIIAMLIAKLVFNENCMAVAGFACLIGHAFPVYFKFKGGKGVAVGAGIALMINPIILAIILSVFIIMVAITKIVSISSICASLGLVVCAFLFGLQGGVFYLAVVSGLFVTALHHKNIIRLIKGEEKKFKPKKK